jgi:predicted transcriptional regulator
LEESGIDNLFFSLASESRLDILQALRVDKLKMNEIARKIDITATEASRQTQRLQEEYIIQKLPDGTYTLTNYGKLVLHFFPAFEFIFKHKQYFLAHDIWQLPYQFISRLGELSQGTLCTEMAGTVNRIENMMRSANDHVWAITDQVMDVHSKVMTEQVSKGVKFRSLFPEKLIHSTHGKVSGKYEKRILTSVPALVVVTEKEAFVALLTMDGNLTHSGFFGTDPVFIKWVADLFLHYWE